MTTDAAEIEAKRIVDRYAEGDLDFDRLQATIARSLRRTEKRAYRAGQKDEYELQRKTWSYPGEAK